MSLLLALFVCGVLLVYLRVCGSVSGGVRMRVRCGVFACSHKFYENCLSIIFKASIPTATKIIMTTVTTTTTIIVTTKLTQHAKL